MWSKTFKGSLLSDISYGNKLFAINSCGLVDGQSSTKIFSLDSGQIISQVDLQANCRYKPLLQGSIIYIGTEDSRIIGFNYVKGQKVWECVLPDKDGLATNIILKNEDVYIGSINRKLYKISLAGGKIDGSWQFEYGLSNLVSWDGSIYFAIGSGDLMKYD